MSELFHISLDEGVNLFRINFSGSIVANLLNKRKRKQKKNILENRHRYRGVKWSVILEYLPLARHVLEFLCNRPSKCVSCCNAASIPILPLRRHAPDDEFYVKTRTEKKISETI